MRRTILAIAMLGVSIGVPGSAHASDADDAAVFQKAMEHVMVDILCSTTVIRDMGALASAYVPKIHDAPDAEERDTLKREFGTKLHQVWINQKYDMSRHQQIVKFLEWMNTQPMSAQSDLAKSWAYSAHKQCPAVADDYRLTNSAALTLVSTIPY